MNDLLELLPLLAGKRVVVVGDLCLDEYIVGQARRLSREAPVPVLEFLRRFTVPGAAANPALNICSLGGSSLMVGVVGDDEAGATLKQRLDEAGIATWGVVVESSRGTTLKTRVLAEGSLRYPQQMVRVDRQEQAPLSAMARNKIIAALEKAIPECDAVLVSDYKAGVVSPEVVEVALSLAQRCDRIITVDSQGDLTKFKGFTVVRCNREEAEAAMRRRPASTDSLFRWGQQMRRKLGSKAVVITLGGDGMTLFENNSSPLHIPVVNRSEVFDVTGAGDTVIAVLTLSLAAGASLAQAVHLANHAAGLVVRKLGNATTTPQELAHSILHSADPDPGLEADLES